MSGLTQKPPRSMLRSPGWWAVIVSIVALVVAILSLIHTDRKDEARDARAAALRMCETYTSGDAMRSVVDKVYEGSIPDVNITSDSQRNYNLAKKGNVDGLRYKHQLTVWLNFLDVVGTGLNSSVYDFNIIKDCFASSFSYASKTLIGSVFAQDDYPNVQKWATNLNNPLYKQ